MYIYICIYCSRRGGGGGGRPFGEGWTFPCWLFLDVATTFFFFSLRREIFPMELFLVCIAAGRGLRQRRVAAVTEAPVSAEPQTTRYTARRFCSLCSVCSVCSALLCHIAPRKLPIANVWRWTSSTLPSASAPLLLPLSSCCCSLHSQYSPPPPKKRACAEGTNRSPANPQTSRSTGIGWP